MEGFQTSAIVIGYTVIVAGGFFLAGILLCVAAYFAGKYAWRAYSGLCMVYRLEHINYWFKRMDANGTHVLRKEHDEKLADKEATNG